MNADARMTRRLEQRNRRYELIMACRAWGKRFNRQHVPEWTKHAPKLPEAAHGPENSLSVDFTDSRSTSLTPAERDDMSVATGDDWA